MILSFCKLTQNFEMFKTPFNMCSHVRFLKLIWYGITCLEKNNSNCHYILEKRENIIYINLKTMPD